MRGVSILVASHDYGAGKSGSAESAPFLTCEFRQVLSRMCITSRVQPVIHELNVQHAHSESLTDGIWNKELNENFLTLVRQHTGKVLLDSSHPCLIGGDHSSSIGAILECNKYCRERGKSFGVLWIDSHPDMNTTITSPSSRLHGMAVAATLGLVDLNCSLHPFLAPDQFLQIGINSVDDGEATNIRQYSVAQYSAKDIVESPSKVRQAMEKWCDKFDFLYLSLDLDVLSSQVAPAVNAPCSNALDFGALITMLHSVPWEKVVMWDLVEFNMRHDIENKTLRIAQSILETIMEGIFQRIVLGENLLALP